MSKKTKIFCIILSVIAVLSLTTAVAFAIGWNGSSSGDNPGTIHVDGNFWLTRDNNTTACVGYRFSVINADGRVAKNQTAILDVYRDSYAYDYFEKSTTKLSKVQLIAQYKSGASNVTFNTDRNSDGCIMQSVISVTLPDPCNMGTWQNREGNLDAVLKRMGYANGTDSLGVNCRVLVEPIWIMVLDGYYQSLTVSEVCAYGIRNSKLGPNSYGGDPDGGTSFGTISGFTNNLWPNALFTNLTDGLQNSDSTYIQILAVLSTVIAIAGCCYVQIPFP